MLYKRLTAILLIFSMLLSMLTVLAGATNSEEEAMNEIKIFNGGQSLSCLAVNGRVQTLNYVYYQYRSATGATKEIPTYCVNPTEDGVPQKVGPGESIEYIIGERASDPKIMGIVANGYPTKSLGELGLVDKVEGYYATKIALWCHIIPGWSINAVTVNPNLSVEKLTQAQRVLAAAKKIHQYGTWWTEVPTAALTTSVDRELAYPVTIDGKSYKQQIFTVTSPTFVSGRVANVAFQDPDTVPAGTRIVNMENEDITQVAIDGSGTKFSGQFKILYPADAIADQEGSVQVKLQAKTYQYGVFYATCAQTDDYGKIQDYLCDTEPTKRVAVSAISKYGTSEIPDDPETGLKIIKVQEGTQTPLAGAIFEIKGPNGDVIGQYSTDTSGTIVVPLTISGTYTVTEIVPPENHTLSKNPTQTVTVSYGKVATVTFENAPYGSLRVEKLSDTGDHLQGVTIQIRHIETGTTYTQKTEAGGAAVFTELQPGAYEVREVSGIEGWLPDTETVVTVSVATGETVTATLKNKELPGLRILKYDRQTMEVMPNVTFEVFKDNQSIGTFKTNQLGEILLPNLEPGTYRVEERHTGDNEHIVEAMPQEIELEAGSGILELVFFNSKKPGLRLVKVDAANPSKVIPNAVFEIKSVDGSFGPQEFTTDENGEIYLDKLDTGWYKVVEVDPPTGYALRDPSEQIIYVDNDKAVELIFENTPLSALIVWKFDSKTGEALEGAVFQVKYLGGTSGTGGTVIGTYKTSANGSFTVTGLEAGTYIVEEIAAPDGHVIDTAPQTVFISGKEQDVVQLYFGNSPNGSLLIKKIDAVTHKPLSDVEFMVTTSDGTVVGNANGKFVTDSAGTILIEGIDPGTTLVVKETRAKDGYLLDDTPQTVKIKSGETVTLEFRNQPKGNLIINKLDSVTKAPLEGVEFELTYSDGSYVDAESGTLSSKGLYRTDKNGQIILSGLTGTIVVTETKTIEGYTIHEETRTQTVVVNPNDTQALTFYNDPVGGVEIIKVNADKPSERIPDTTFEIRKVDDELIGTVTTDENGRVFVSLEDGAYYAVEIEANPDYRLDDTPHYFEIEGGKTVTLKVTNQKNSGILIHKVNTSGEGIYGVKFLLYDEDRNPIGEFTSDDNGYVYITADDLPDGANTSGRFYLRELEAAEGYILDKEYKTVYVRPGHTAEIEWVNEAITGQIQIYKYAAEYNAVTGTPAGTPLQGAVYEISNARTGKVVDYITTDARGVAASKPLPLTRYKIVEVTAPPYWQVDPTVHDVTLEYVGQIIKVSAYDKPSNLGVTITKRGNTEVLAGQTMRYDLTMANTSNVPLDNFYWHDKIPYDVARATTLTTGTYSARLNYRILYKTNYQSSYQVLASNLLTSNNYSFALNAIPMQAGEVVTDVYFDFGKVPVGFQSVTGPTLSVIINGNTVNGYQLVNRADVGGKYQGTWQTAQASWVTIVRKHTTTPNLPQTGY